MTGGNDDGYRRSEFCSGGTCVEVAPQMDGWVAVRDSKDRTKPEHRFTADEWAEFVRGVKAGQFDFGPGAEVKPSVETTVRLTL